MSESIPSTTKPKLVERGGRWYYEVPLPDMEHYSGPFFGGEASDVTMRGCSLLIDAGVGVYRPDAAAQEGAGHGE